MPQQTTISVPANTWTQLTDANVTTITFQNVGGDFVRIRATNGTTAPTGTLGALRYNPGQGERNIALTDLSPGISGANRVWAFAPAGGLVVVSHA